MQISKTALGLILAAGVTAGAGGAFLAGRTEAPVAEASEADGVSANAARVDNPGRAIGADTVVPTGGVRRDSAAAPPRAPERVEAARPVTRPPAAAPVASIAPVAPVAPIEVVPAPAPVVVDARPPVAPDPVSVAEAPRAPEPVGPELIELVVSADSVIGLQLDSTITSERARVEDPVEAHVVRDVRVGDRVAIPAGSNVAGQVTVVDRGGRLKERARLGVRFTEIALPNGTRLPIQTETVFREGDSQMASSSAKIGGGALGGAILGGILGGAKGAAIGGSVGAGAGTAAVMAGGRNQATLASGSPVTIRIEQPIVITTER